MPLVAGLLGGRTARLLATLLVLHSLKVATSAVSLSVDEPRFLVGGVAVVDSAQHPLLAIVRCNDGRLDMNISEVFVADSGSLHVQFEENSNRPTEFFVLPNSTGASLIEGEYQIEVACRSESTVSEAAEILVSILTPTFATEIDQPYFTVTPRYVTVSASSPTGTIIATYKAEFQAPSSLHPGTQRYVVHDDFLDAPFQLNSSSGELAVSQSLRSEDTLSKYDIVIVADQGQSKAWTVTTVIIEPLKGLEEQPTLNGSGMRGQASQVILTVIAIVSVWSGHILS